MEIRKITEKDKEIFLQMGREFYSSEAVLENIDESFHEAAFAELMRSDMYLDCYLFEEKGCIMGYALLNKSFGHEAGGVVIWVEELYIRPPYQGKGIGSHFFDWLEDNIPAARYRLEIEPDNTGAVRLYQRKGFRSLPYGQMVKDVHKK